MPLSPSQSGPLAFGEFLNTLQRQGFSIGVDHHLRLHRLLERLGSQCAPQELKQVLCPIFASSKEEQDLFYRAFDDFFPFFIDPESAKAAVSLRQDHAEEIDHRVDSPRPVLGRTALVLLALAIALLVLTVARRTGGPATPTPSPAASIQPPATTTPSLIPIPSGQPLPTAETPGPSPIATPSPDDQPAPIGARNKIDQHRNLLRGLALALPLAAFAYAEWRRRRRQRLALERSQGLTPPVTWPVSASAPEMKIYRTETFYRAARWLRRRQVGEFERLDIARTIAATIETRGYPSFRYRPDSRVPEYLILIDRATPRDHQARLFDLLAQALDREGLFTVRYFYDGDPRVCLTGTGVGDMHLTELQKRYPAHRLLLFGDGEALLDPISGRLAPWAALLLEWPERAVLTPLRASDWGHRERALADHFILVTATFSGLAEMAERFETPSIAESERADPREHPTPPPEIEPTTPPEQAVVQLKKYLGEDAFQWLCAVAVYPELQWELTLSLGSLPSMPRGLLQEQTLLRLCSLPWLRAGAFPDALRLELIKALDPAREAAVRAALIKLLEQNAAPVGSFAESDRRLQIVVQQAWSSRNETRPYRQAVEAVKDLPPEEARRDYTLLHLLEEHPPSRLALLLPRPLLKTVYPEGIALWGTKSAVRGATALLAVIVGWVAIEALGTQPQVPPAVGPPVIDPAGSPQVVQTPTHETSPVPTSSVSPTATPSQPTLATNSRNVNFGSVEVQEQTSQGSPSGNNGSLQIFNSGTGPLTVGQIAITGANAALFSITKNECANRAIPPKLGCRLSLRFAPPQPGQFNAALIISSNGNPNQTRIGLTGTGYSRPVFTIEPTDLDFGIQPVGRTAGPLRLSLTNTGVGTFRVGEVSIGDSRRQQNGPPTQNPAAKGAFALTTNECTNKTLQPKESCSIQISFTPSYAGEFYGGAIVRIGSSMATPSMKGVGRAPQSAK
jgi:hypothetical protein